MFTKVKAICNLCIRKVLLVFKTVGPILPLLVVLLYFCTLPTAAAMDVNSQHSGGREKGWGVL